MKFEDYAFREHVKTVDDMPGSPIAIICPFKADEMGQLMRMTAEQLVKRPSLNSHGARPMAVKTIKEQMPMGDRVPEDRLDGSVQADAVLRMPTLFATLGYAALQTRLINIHFVNDLKTAVDGDVKSENAQIGAPYFESFRDDVLGGTQFFFQSGYKRLGRPPAAVMLAVILPRLLS